LFATPEHGESERKYRTRVGYHQTFFFETRKRLKYEMHMGHARIFTGDLIDKGKIAQRRFFISNRCICLAPTARTIAAEAIVRRPERTSVNTLMRCGSRLLVITHPKVVRLPGDDTAGRQSEFSIRWRYDISALIKRLYRRKVNQT